MATRKAQVSDYGERRKPRPRGSALREDERVLAGEDGEKLVQELKTHQVELEMQNEQLRTAQQAIEESRAKYSDLYDFAPVGYFTFDEEMTIREVNRTGAALLGLEPKELVGKPFSLFIKPEYQDILYHHRQKVLAESGIQSCELVLVSRGEGRDFYVSLESIPGQDHHSIRSAVFDITDRKLAEIRIHQLSAELMTAQEQERKRIAHEIHDELTGSLSALLFSLETKIQKLEKGEPINVENLKRMISLLKTTLNETRRIMNNLRPSILDDLGLLPTLEWFCREYRNIYPKIRLDRHIAIEEDDIPDDLKLILFRLLQEALNHFARYGQGDVLQISLVKDGPDIEFSIGDNARAFDPENDRQGFDLESMRERVEASGGCFSLESTKEGSILQASWKCKTSPSSFRPSRKVPPRGPAAHPDS
jgi:PAS domain S-box-containing protein